MQLLIAVTVGLGAEEVIGVFSTPAKANDACRSEAAKRKISYWHFMYYPATLDTVIV